MLDLQDQQIETKHGGHRATYKVPEAAHVAGVGTAAIRKKIRENKIPNIRFGRNILIPRAAFHRWLDSCGESIFETEKQPEVQ